ncbi:hypothetical protein [Pedobacter cryoconitis]|uniref:hypothetical protein n=1 Tax=Pedobacter cryoconitis TaxID=188932 RepID=UPI0012F7412D|nr:hypothetical protein [Pedobacter cryoconitis]
MPIPIFIFHELLFRIQLFDPSIGSYVSHSYTKSGAVIVTTTRTVRISRGLLNKQFKDPTLIPEAAIQKLIA